MASSEKKQFRLTPFGVISKYLHDENIAWSSFHTDRIMELLVAEGYQITNRSAE